ncbi:acetyl-CoA carboxylase [Schistosoma mansoni]|uniref:acetyl-CoA carboxylase n=1 Tax=Schistosoma mansoni TaxID=6183 RepID=UPI0001A63992|nr:acetyl-CoA carboxylase [Schistosoma mansoni]|eukprot:XP_018652089.1 acetyl-CoA carboxylase [Schistosoma mansoni]
MAVTQDVHNVNWQLGRSDDNSEFSSHTLAKPSSNFKVRFSSPEDFVRKSGGVRIIEKILIANNGIAAVKCMRSLRKWSYATFGSSDVLRFVCMATPEDIQANAEYIKMANKMVLVPGGSNVNNYANVELILQTAVTNEVDVKFQCVYLYTFLYNFSLFSLGPSHQAMWTLGDKVASTILAQSAHVPTLPWSGSVDNLTLNMVKSTGLPQRSSSVYSRLISEDLYRSGCVTDVSSCLKCAEKIGYPVMIKASAGGGGKGIRKALTSADIERFFPQVQAEVPGSPIFVMKCATSVRHLEVQILCDIYGQAISMFGRDCSVQRRHQKIIEEAPIIVAPKEIIEQMEQAAVRLSKLVSYVSAGTVEYLYDPDSNQFYFLELNPRLQVEHPCTEVVAEVNLPACQLQIAMGIPLHRIKDIRELYLAPPWSDSIIDFNDPSINRRPPSCYVIAARITSEDPDEGFKPRPGGVRELNFRSNQSVWGYFSVSSAGGIHEFADSQFGHIFSAGENREHARENMVLALKELSIRGDFRTTVEYLIKVMECEAFMNHKINTEWLDARIAQNDQVEKPDILLGVICTALHIADNCLKQLFLNYELHLERGQFLPSKTLTNSVDVTLVSDSTKYIVRVLRTGPSNFSLICCDTVLDLEVHRVPGDGLLVCHEAASYMTYCHEESQGYRTVINNRTMMLCKETDPTVLRSHSAGKLLQYCVTEGSHVCANEVYALIEVMKMIFELRVPTSGIITLKRIPGAILEPGTELARIELDELNQLKPLQIFSPNSGGDPMLMLTNSTTNGKLHLQFTRLLASLEQILFGYCLCEPYFSKSLMKTLNQFLTLLYNPRLPLHELQDTIAHLKGQLPSSMEKSLRLHAKLYADQATSVLANFPSEAIIQITDEYLKQINNGQLTDCSVLEFQRITQRLIDLAERYKHGLRGHTVRVISQLFMGYVVIEKHFQHGQYDKCIRHLLAKCQGSTLWDIVSVIFSHRQLIMKNVLIINLIQSLIERRELCMTDQLQCCLKALTELGGTRNSKVALTARQLLISVQTPSYELRRNQVESIFLSAIDTFGQQIHPELLLQLINSETVVFDILTDFFYHPNHAVASAALEVYIRRSYTAYELTGVHHFQLSCGSSFFTFRFLLPNEFVSRQDIRLPTKGRVYCSAVCSFLLYGSETCPIRVDDIPRLLVFDHRCLRSIARISWDHRVSNAVVSKRVLYKYIQPNGISSSSSNDDTSAPSKSKPSGFNKNSLLLPDSVINETSDVTHLEKFCSRHVDQLRASGIRRITFLVVKTREFPRLYTFRARDNYREDRVYRHLEPALAFQLELNRMKNYNLDYLPTLNRRMHLYLGCSKINGRKDVVDYRFFVRCIIRHADLVSREASFEYLQSEAEQILLEAMDALDLASGHPDASRTMGNHIFLNFVPVLLLEDINRLKSTIRKVVMRYARRFLRLRVSQAELKLHIRFHASDPIVPIRVMLRDEHGYDLGLDVYREVLDPVTGICILQSISPLNGRLNGHPAVRAHENKDFFEVKRFQARKFNTTYVYDYPALLAQALTGVWQSYCPYINGKHADLTSISDHTMNDSFNESNSSFKSNSLSKFHGLIPLNIPENLVITCTELSLDKYGNLQPNTNTLGTNEIGMVVWYMVLRTPETPSGRPIIVTANDATFQAGSFGPAEDLTFHRASQLARYFRIPQIYLASNTGARIKIAEDIKNVFNIAWIDAEHPEKGYKYLYLTPDDYYRFKYDEAVNCERIEENGEIRYKIIDIIGKEYDMSAENLRGSAMIAGETSAAYDDIFTITIVTNRAIGIGAYLTRLGQRVIQVNNSHIILTGAMALNKLLGREVYSSNSQLGGVQVMATNGVSHLVASDELSALQLAIEWLSYIPQFHQPKVNKQTDFYLPFDPIDRIVEYIPSRDRPNDDPRWMFTGIMSNKQPSLSDQQFENANTDHWISGFFDWGTWQETLSSWAAGVVTGRARLGGIPCGVITAETRSVVCRVPADPANLSSEAQIVNQAGQVWYPDSAYKTAQAIADLSREHLPLFIFANWRGFSGGMKDMYDQVLKFGSMIIDSLRRYTKPVFVYLPPNSQLRGGAWVVVDPAINPDFMEMYADPISSRAGVLEPEGTVEIKYRQKDLINTINRLDDTCKLLLKELNHLNEHTNNLSMNDDQDVPLLFFLFFHIFVVSVCFFLKVACKFADLHDTPGRLLARKLVHRLVDWSSSRCFFYTRLRRRLLELSALNLITNILSNSSDPYPIDTKYTTTTGNTTNHNVPFLNFNCETNKSKEISLKEEEETEFKQSSVKLLRVASNHRIRFDSESLTQTVTTNDIPNNSDGRYSLSTTTLKSTVCNKEEVANIIAKQVPNLAISYTYHTNQKMSLLKSWFIEALNNANHKTNNGMPVSVNNKCLHITTGHEDVPDKVDDEQNTTTSSPEPLKLLNPYEIWDNNDLIVGNWLANELNCNELRDLATIENVQEFCSPDTLNCLSFTSINNSPTTNSNLQLFEQNIIKTKIKQLHKDNLIEHVKQSLINSSQLSSNELITLFKTVLTSSERCHLAKLLLSDSTIKIDDINNNNDHHDDNMNGQCNT